MRIPTCLCLLILSACDSPSVAVQHAPAVEVASGGHVFSVRVWGDYAESIRTDRAFPPPRANAVVAAAIPAMEQASGCKVLAATVEGDAAIQKARLSCG